MKKNSLPKPITILILTLLTVLLWAGLSIYRTITVKPASEISENVMKPINPTLNTNVIQKIESAIFIPDSEVPSISLKSTTDNVSLPTTEIAPISSPESSPSSIVGTEVPEEEVVLEEQ